MRILQPESLGALFSALGRRGFVVVGPTVRNRAVVYDELDSPEDLPVGWTDEQDGGTYRLVRRDDSARFGYVIGPHSWKKFLFPPHKLMWGASRSGDGFAVEVGDNAPPRYAFVGVRPCELKAIEIQDRVFLEGVYVDDDYKALRREAFVIVVNCTRAANTCFCVSMDTGPRAKSGFDLALTEILDEDGHYFAAESGSDRGAELLEELPGPEANGQQNAAVDAAIARAATHMGRRLETEGLKELLYENYEHPRWEQVAKRCLTCGNCTMVCPTCFCSTVEDSTDVAGDKAERLQRWDSCFTTDFSYIHGGHLRRTAKARYRQWMTHKLATWQDQFGTIGCVGCGRCITWCPVGIDITEEVRSIRANEQS